MNVALTQIVRTTDGTWTWTVEYDDPHLGRCGDAETYEAAAEMVRGIVEGKV